MDLCVIGSENIDIKNYFLPKSTDIKCIDFGSAVFYHEDRTGVINTRQYRAPEVILANQKWDYKSDIWGVACILVELYSGDLLFPTHDSVEHMLMIEKINGNIPSIMIENTQNSEFDEVKQIVSIIFILESYRYI